MEKTRKFKKPRKIPVVKPSKFEAAEAIQVNRKYWNNVFENMDTTQREPTAQSQSMRLSQVLPGDLYEKVCQTLDIPIVRPIDIKTEIPKISTPRRLLKEPLLSFRKSLFVDRELDSDTDVELSSGCKTLNKHFGLSEETAAGLNIHQELLRKPEREQITWATRYLQPEREDEKTLVRKADDLTDRIAQEFCEYMKQLGGDQQSQLFTPKAIKELFQIEFDTHVARSLRVIPKEMPSVIESVAQYTNNPEQSRFAVLEREVSKDIRAERRMDKLKAFGTSLSLQEQWKTPHNNTKNLWRSARHVPKDLVTLKAVWEGITNLSSVKEYCRWMIEHPEHRRAPYLSSLGMFDSAVLEARLTFEAQPEISSPQKPGSDLIPPPIEQIKRRLSQLAEST